ncbi:thiol peroxidase [Allocatelliglobosispora scoriae]|uniref:Thiol peroxidase n=1 Tax=Allocatelliglobosispora scoriae TaxID=643052 RepID=A0A841BTB8_9ACTN|nr:thiol peroxidase [Allocatelliglobosispora scoriae]MBB5870030.1 thiol peroxidase [Allocatelliglobosispora scoriae]
MAGAVERSGVTTFRGQPVTLLGGEVKVGTTAPEFAVIGGDMSTVTLASSRGTVRLITSVPSLDTEVCSVETRRFNTEAASLPGVTMLTVSVDLPFAQRRWCDEAAADAVQVTSDHRDLSFGLAYGVAIKELRLLARAVFVVDADDTVVWTEYVPELGHHPDYTGALAAARAALPGA